jgi:integrase
MRIVMLLVGIRLVRPETKNIVDWDERPLQRWLSPITHKGTMYNYRSGFRLYALFTGMTAAKLIDEALEDSKRGPREKQGIVLQRVIGFYKWLKTEYEVKSRGKGPHKVVRKGLSDKLAQLYVTAVRSFYSTYDVFLRLKGRYRLPKPKIENKRIRVSAEQVKILVGHARSLRDRAVILTLFQGGLEASTLCSVDYSKELEEGLRRNEHPLKLEIYRPKTGAEYYTFLGQDAANAIKAYLKDARKRGVRSTYGMPLFVKHRRTDGQIRRLKPHNVQNMLKGAAIRSGFVDETLNGKAFNPLGPHALRESFDSIMINSGVPDTIVDFWLGHEIGDLARTYKGSQYKNLREIYLEREGLLSISKSKVDLEEIEKKVRIEVEESSRELQNLLNRLARDSMETKERMHELQIQIKETRETRQASDEVINRLFEDREFREFITRKIKELS